MSVVISPARSTQGSTSDSAGQYPPGKMYLVIQGLVASGTPCRPIACSSATPSGARQRRITSKNAPYCGTPTCSNMPTETMRSNRRSIAR